jgi:hypothetical protein
MAARKPKALEVVAGAVVLKTSDGSERYLYQGAPVIRSAFDDDSIARAIKIGLIAETEAPAESGDEQDDAGSTPAS